MSGPIATSDLEPAIPDELLQASGRPITGWLLQGWVASLLGVGGWVAVSATEQPAWWGLSGAGLLAFFAVPSIAKSLVLDRFAKRVASCERSKVRGMLGELRDSATLKLFAPHAWINVQEGRLHLRAGDGRAAARAFAEAERVCKHSGDKAELISAQAHALALAGDRKEARELFGKLAKLGRLTRLDHLDFGVVLLSETGHNKEALEHLEKARDAYGGHPRVLAGLVIALDKVDRPAEAAELLEAAEAALEHDNDPIAQELVKRGRKGLRTYLQAKQKRERKQEPVAEPKPIAEPKTKPVAEPKRVAEAKPTAEAKPVAEAKPTAEPKPTADAQPEEDAGKKKSEPKGKKGRKQARRDARKQAKAEARRGGSQANES